MLNSSACRRLSKAQVAIDLPVPRTWDDLATSQSRFVYRDPPDCADYRTLIGSISIFS